MPPKRSASDTSSSSSKKVKTGRKAKSGGLRTMKSERWSRVSASGNADAAYKASIEDPVKAYSYVCICRVPWNGEHDREDEDDEDEGDEEDEDDKEDEDDSSQASSHKSAKKKSKPSCDGGETCLCDKPAAEHPDHPWILTNAGKTKWLTQHTFLDLRCPDAFNMYTYNDHAGYGALEVVQNLFIDFVEAFFDWQEQWAVCEATAMLYMGNGLWPLHGVDSADAPHDTLVLVGRQFLAMLARLEHLNLLGPDSEVENLGLIMALYIKLAAAEDIYDYHDDTEEIKKNNGTDETFTFVPSEFPSYILAYAKKYNIKLVEATGVEKVIEILDEEVELPEPSPNEHPLSDLLCDPWDLSDASKEYVENHATYYDGHRGLKTYLGGDALDITTWTSAERKKASFDGKDPLSKEDIDSIKKGMVLGFA